MKDISETNVILRVLIIRNEDNILLSQEPYTKKLVREFDY